MFSEAARAFNLGQYRYLVVIQGLRFVNIRFMLMKAARACNLGR